jgi:hypothetical protein
MRTSGRRIKSGERRRIQCDHCNALFDKRLLHRDGEGLWTCPQEGPGRDAVTLTRGNAEALRDFTQRLRVPPEITGRYGNIPVEALANKSGNILGEDGTPITGEDEVYILGG